MYSYDRTAEGPSDYDQAIEVLDRELKPFPKKHGWWDPPHNYGVNSAIMELNGWYFTILPLFAAKIAYRPKSDRFPEGIVIDPNWAPVKGHTGPHTANTAAIFVKAAKAAPSVQDSVKQELKSIETHFKVDIPASVQSKLIGESLKVAQRRWGVDRLRRRKILVPFDGSKPIELGSFD
jgi:hypothetical protein